MKNVILGQPLILKVLLIGTSIQLCSSIPVREKQVHTRSAEHLFDALQTGKCGTVLRKIKHVCHQSLTVLDSRIFVVSGAVRRGYQTDGLCWVELNSSGLENTISAAVSAIWHVLLITRQILHQRWKDAKQTLDRDTSCTPQGWYISVVILKNCICICCIYEADICICCKCKHLFVMDDQVFNAKLLHPGDEFCWKHLSSFSSFLISLAFTSNTKYLLCLTLNIPVLNLFRMPTDSSPRGQMCIPHL